MSSSSIDFHSTFLTMCRKIICDRLGQDFMQQPYMAYIVMNYLLKHHALFFRKVYWFMPLLNQMLIDSTNKEGN